MADTILPFRIITSSGEQVFPNVVDTTIEFSANTNKIKITIWGDGNSFGTSLRNFRNYTFSTISLATLASNSYSVSNVVIDKIYYTNNAWYADLICTLSNDLNVVTNIIAEVPSTISFGTISPLGNGDSWTISSGNYSLWHTEGTYATKTITGQSWVKANSFIACNISGLTSADHTPEDAVLEGVNFEINNIVVGTGFDIVGHATEGTYGKYSIRCLGY